MVVELDGSSGVAKCNPFNGCKRTVISADGRCFSADPCGGGIACVDDIAWMLLTESEKRRAMKKKDLVCR